MTTDILWFSELGLKDLDRVGGKNASLGEMVQNLTSAGVQVPDGFATTADAYRNFLAESGLDQKIADRLVGLDTDDVTALAAAGQEIRALMISRMYRELPARSLISARPTVWMPTSRSRRYTRASRKTRRILNCAKGTLANRSAQPKCLKK